jgi:predicted DNA-binding protein (UPF0251 family)
MPAIASGAPISAVVPTRVLAVGVDAAVLPSLRRALPAGPLRLEMAGDFLAAVGSVLGEEWDVVVAGLGENAENDLRLWLKTLEQARGHPRFIAVMQRAQHMEEATVAVEGATLADVEARHIRRVLESTGGRVMEAAKILGVHRNTLARKLKALRNGSENDGEPALPG